MSLASVPAQEPQLIVRVGDTTVCGAQQNVPISVFLSNLSDTVAGFNVWLQLDRPDVMVFQTVIDTVIDTTYWRCTEWDGPDCIDSMIVSPLGEWDFFHVDTNEILIGNVDTEGTLIADWEYVDSRSLSGMGTDLNVVALANLFPPPTTAPIAPQEDGLLIKLLVDTYDLPDSATVKTMIQSSFLSHFSFSRPDGSLIGVVYQGFLDTNYFVCTQWSGETCLNWIQVSMPPADSIEIVADSMLVLDTTYVEVIDGSLTWLPMPAYGDIDGSGAWDIADLVYLVDWFFTGGPPPQCPLAADCNGDGEVDISDLVCWVEIIFPSR